MAGVNEQHIAAAKEVAQFFADGGWTKSDAVARIAKIIAKHAPDRYADLDELLCDIAVRIRWEDVRSVQHGDRTEFLQALRRLIECAPQIKSGRYAEWKEAVIEACVVNHLDFSDHAAVTLGRLIHWECQTALDPKVSKEAADLVAQSRNEVLEEVAKTLERRARNLQVQPDPPVDVELLQQAKAIRALIGTPAQPKSGYAEWLEQAVSKARAEGMELAAKSLEHKSCTCAASIRRRIAAPDAKEQV